MTLTKKQEKTQKLLKEMDAMQAQYGGRKPEYITMYFSIKLACWTKVLAALTFILAILTVTNIWILICHYS